MVVALVYHKPGSPDGFRVVEELARRVSLATGRRVEVVEVDEGLPRGCRHAVAVLPAPGGHLEQVKARAGSMGGCRVSGPIDWRVQARVVARALDSSGCRGGVVFYWRAKRFKREQDAWVSSIASLASRLHGAPVAAAGLDFGSPPPGGGGCAFPLTLFPGRLAEALRGAGWRLAAESILSSGEGFREVLSWILGELGSGDL
ncbi:hypothetical protein [Stetteria hydrogenophila]